MQVKSSDNPEQADKPRLSIKKKFNSLTHFKDLTVLYLQLSVVCLKFTISTCLAVLTSWLTFAKKMSVKHKRQNLTMNLNALKRCRDFKFIKKLQGLRDHCKAE